MAGTAGAARRQKSRPQRGRLRRIASLALKVVLVSYLTVVALLVSLRWVNPPTTAVQAQRRIESMFGRGAYTKRYQFVPLSAISPDLQHAVLASEDTRFYDHHGFDWKEIQNAMDKEDEDRPMRGASTITQQLVKNLFLSTKRSLIRKGVEASLVPVAEFALGKQRILELYLNVVEWGPGVFGAEAACQYHYRTGARSIGREQAARLAAILPNPLRRKPERMNAKTGVILTRMRQMGW